MDQKLDFGPCDPSVANPQPAITSEVAKTAECSTLTVPMDYEKLDRKTIKIAVLRVPASGDRIGSVVVNPGGPGLQVTSFAPILAAIWAKSPVVQRFDLVGFDPRGVGLSRPAIDCLSDAQREADQHVGTINGTADDWKTKDSTREMAEQCAAGSGGKEMLAHVGTRDAARDMDVLRAALGDRKLSFAGMSYGTRLGAVYAEMFPQKVRALVLDGAVDPLKDTRERKLQQAVGLQRSFEQVAAFCATQPDCPLGNDPTKATAVVQQLLQPLFTKPIRSADGREVTFSKATDGIVSGLYSKAEWPQIIAGLTELRDGHAEQLLALRDSYYGRSESGRYSNDIEATFAINCMDEDRLTPRQATKLIRDTAAKAPFIDPGVDFTTRDGCEAWPAKPTLVFPYATDIHGLPKVLVTSVTGDGPAPHQGGIDLAKTLGARLLTVKGEQHGAIIARNACVDKAVADYLIDLTLPKKDTGCSL